MVLLSAKDRLVESASRLFYQNGFHATGIEKILADASVSKMTLYRHFRSKNELILAVMKNFDERFRDWLTKHVDAAGDDPLARLEAVFSALKELVKKGAYQKVGFHGCLFVKAASEFNNHGDPVHKVAADHKRWFMKYIKRLVKAAPVSNSDELATALFLEFEGAYVTAQVTGDTGIAGRAQKVAKALIKTSLSR